MIIDLDADVFNSTPWRTFTYLDSEKNIKSAMEICLIIGKSEAAETFLNYFMDFLDGQNENLKEAILIINQIASGKSIFHINWFSIV